MNRLKLIILALFLVLTSAELQFSSTNDFKIITGDNFKFGINEPSNWTCFTEDAYKYKLNAYFCLRNYKYKSTPVIMYITIHGKYNHSINELLKRDMEGFKKSYDDIKFIDFNIGTIQYNYASKIYLMNDKDTDFLFYIDPGEKLNLFTLLVLSGPKKKCEQYTNDFVNLIKSFVWYNDDSGTND